MIATCIRDITEGFQDCAIVHCCNCFNTMGTGVALALRRKWPQVYHADCETVKGDRKKLGTWTLADVDEGNVVYNIYGQYTYGREKRQVDYEALYRGLDGVISHMKNESGCTALVVPYKMGCNNAGGDWRIVLSMLEVLMEKHNITIWICQKP